MFLLFVQSCESWILSLFAYKCMSAISDGLALSVYFNFCTILQMHTARDINELDDQVVSWAKVSTWGFKSLTLRGYFKLNETIWVFIDLISSGRLV